MGGSQGQGHVWKGRQRAPTHQLSRSTRHWDVPLHHCHAPGSPKESFTTGISSPSAALSYRDLLLKHFYAVRRCLCHKIRSPPIDVTQAHLVYNTEPTSITFTHF